MDDETVECTEQQADQCRRHERNEHAVIAEIDHGADGQIHGRDGKGGEGDVDAAGNHHQQNAERHDADHDIGAQKAEDIVQRPESRIDEADNDHRREKHAGNDEFGAAKEFHVPVPQFSVLSRSLTASSVMVSPESSSTKRPRCITSTRLQFCTNSGTSSEIIRTARPSSRASLRMILWI
ncbi:hypothetical protein D3C80_274890 [compost metagenome]